MAESQPITVMLPEGHGQTHTVPTPDRRRRGCMDRRTHHVVGERIELRPAVQTYPGAHKLLPLSLMMVTGVDGEEAALTLEEYVQRHHSGIAYLHRGRRHGCALAESAEAGHHGIPGGEVARIRPLLEEAARQRRITLEDPVLIEGPSRQHAHARPGVIRVAGGKGEISVHSVVTTPTGERALYVVDLDGRNDDIIKFANVARRRGHNATAQELIVAADALEFGTLALAGGDQGYDIYRVDLREEKSGVVYARHQFQPPQRPRR